jgi:hypothetical protein
VPPNSLPPRRLLQALLEYDGSTGLLRWKWRAAITSEQKRWNTRYAGRAASWMGREGRRRIKIRGRTYLTSRVIWKISYGSDPDVVDHIDGNPSNDRISNLRSVSQQANARNTKLYRNAPTSTPGVRFRDGAWQARVGQQHIGCFPTQKEAVTARNVAASALGFHPNHGRSK